jgi:hypothetical protein
LEILHHQKQQSMEYRNTHDCFYWNPQLLITIP